eukprot:13914892-Alexandrium_andersonii.AAC.1
MFSRRNGRMLPKAQCLHATSRPGDAMHQAHQVQQHAGILHKHPLQDTVVVRKRNMQGTMVALPNDGPVDHCVLAFRKALDNQDEAQTSLVHPEERPDAASQDKVIDLGPDHATGVQDSMDEHVHALAFALARAI